MTSNNRYNRGQSRRRAALMRRRIFFGAALALAIGLIVLVVFLIRNAVGKNDDPLIKLTATQSALASPAVTIAAEASLAATVAPSADMTAPPAADETAAPTAQPTAQTQGATGAQDGLRSVHMRVIGDIMFHKEQLEIAKQADGSYDFHSQFQYIYESLAAADYTIANLETTVGKSEHLGYSGYPQFNTPESVLKTLKDCGIDFFTMANNHMLDRYLDGLIKDVDLVEEYGFDHVGAYRTQAERDAPVVYEIGGIKMGFVAYTHTTNTLENYSDAGAKEYGVPWLYKSDIESDIKKLRDAGAEVVIALPHWGTENVDQPDESQYKYAKRLALAGADIILGSHSHMVQPMGLFSGTDSAGNQKELFAIYSMGNFISAMTMEYTDCGIILDFTIQEQADGTFKVQNIGYVPLYVWKQDKQLYVISSAKYLENRPDGMSDSEYNRMVESYHEIVEHLGTDGFTVLEE